MGRDQVFLRDGRPVRLGALATWFACLHDALRWALNDHCVSVVALRLSSVRGIDVVVRVTVHAALVVSMGTVSTVARLGMQQETRPFLAALWADAVAVARRAATWLLHLRILRGLIIVDKVGVLDVGDAF